ncbi:MAG: hypothetical protein RH860_08980 [Cytophagales bacterium]
MSDFYIFIESLSKMPIEISTANFPKNGDFDGDEVKITGKVTIN